MNITKVREPFALQDALSFHIPADLGRQVQLLLESDSKVFSLNTAKQMGQLSKILSLLQPK